MVDAAPYTRLAGVYDEFVVDPCHPLWADFLDALWGLDPDGVASVLDVGCGTGLLAAELIARGCRVVGVDASPAMLARARHRLGPGTVLVHQVLPDLTIGGVFDAAVSSFDSLNYLTATELRSTMASLARRLRPSGWLVVDLHTDAMMAFTASNPVVQGESDGHRFAISSLVAVAARWCDTTVEMTRVGDGDTFAERHRQYFHSDVTVREALVDAGFAEVTVTEEYTHEPADEATLRATWTARRLAT